MTAERMIKVCEAYKRMLELVGVRPHRASMAITSSFEDVMAHVAWQCGEVIRMLQEDHGGGARERADRMFGFIRGVLCSDWSFSIRGLASPLQTIMPDADSCLDHHFERDGIPWLQSAACIKGYQHCSLCPEVRCGDNCTDILAFAGRLREIKEGA